MRKIISAYLIFATIFWAVGGSRCFAFENATSTGQAPDAGAQTPVVEENAAPAAPAPDLTPLSQTTTTEGATSTPPSGENREALPPVVFGALETPAPETVAAGNGDSPEAATASPESLSPDLPPQMIPSVSGPAASSTIENSATSTVLADLEILAAANINTASSTIAATSTAAFDQPAAIVAQWAMVLEGRDDLDTEFSQIAPSGQFGIDKEFQICALAAGSPATREWVYGQIFYPRNSGFAADDARGRVGCGQLAGPAIRLDEMDAAASFDLFCEKIQKGNPGLPRFASGLGYVDFCSADGLILAGKAQVYCAPVRRAFDDIAGNYEIGLIAQAADGAYGELLLGSFEYLPQPKLEIDFSHVDYGRVKEKIAATAELYAAENYGSTAPLLPETSPVAASGDEIEPTSHARVSNAGNVPARITLWQDDMGLGQTQGAYNIVYGVRMNGREWAEYGPFEKITLNEVLPPGQSANLDFSVKVLDYPDEVGDKKDYAGKMELDAVTVAGANVCAASLADSPAPNAPAPESLPAAPENDPVKPETAAPKFGDAPPAPAPE